MRTIGLIGGTSWVSTLEYYRIINTETNARRGGVSAARILLDSLDFGEVSACNGRGDFDAVGEMVTRSARTLEAAGADCMLLCANTTHMHADRVQAAVSVPLIHLVDATAREIVRQGLHTVGLLGTRPTMEMDFYATRLRAHGIDTLVPDKTSRDDIHEAIETELTKSIFTDERRTQFVATMRSLAARGAQGVILGCTEIPLLVSQDQCPVPGFDTTRLHAMAAVDFALAG
jgi:aspartate racemase